MSIWATSHSPGRSSGFASSVSYKLKLFLDCPLHYLIAKPETHQIAITMYLSVLSIHKDYLFGLTYDRTNSLFILSGNVRFLKTFSMRYWLFLIVESFQDTSCLLHPLLYNPPTYIRGAWSLFLVAPPYHKMLLGPVRHVALVKIVLVLLARTMAFW